VAAARHTSVVVEAAVPVEVVVEAEVVVERAEEEAAAAGPGSAPS
jgi:hypothetical protein